MMPGMHASRLLALVLLLAGCTSGAADWTKASADNAAVAAAYADCKDLADTAVQTEADINQDILATRGGDWGRSGIGRVETQATSEHTGRRTGNVVETCMRAKGFSPAR